MSWIIVGLAGAGAVAGAATSKKGGKDRWKRAAIGAGIGATAGIGAGAMGIGAAGAAGSAPLAGTATGAATTAGTTGGATSGLLLGEGAGVGGLGSLSSGMGATTAATTAGGSAPLAAASGGGGNAFLSGLMRNDPNGNQFMQQAKSQMTSKMVGSLMGGGEEQAAPAVGSPEYDSFTPVTAPTTASPIAMALEQERIRRYRLGQSVN